MKKSAHDKNLECLLHHGIFERIDNILVVGKEVQFYDGHKGVIAEPDGLVYDGKTLYVIEYKQNGDSEHDAMKQLRRAEKYMREVLHLTVPIKLIPISGPVK